MPKFDTDDIRRQNPLTELLPKLGVRLMKDGREWRCLCPLHGEKTPSFTIFVGRDRFQKFQCFGCNSNGDVIQFAQEFYGVEFKEACEILGGKRKAPERSEPAAPVEEFDPYDGYEAVKPPDAAPAIVAGKPTPPLLNPKRGNSITYTPSAVYPYRNRDGDLLAYVLRVDLGNGRKHTPAILWLANEETGFEGWSHGSMPEPRPLYRLPDLYDREESQVLVVEGEKCADAGAELFDDLVTVTWIGGATTAAKSNWKHLEGRSVVCWPDNDPEGESAMLGCYSKRGEWRPGVAELALDAGSRRVKVIARPGDEHPKGWDLANAREKMDAEQIFEWIKPRVTEWTYESIERRKESLRPGPEQEPEPEPTTAPAAITTLQAKPSKKKRESEAEAVPGSRVGNVIALRGEQIPPPHDIENWRANLLFNAEEKLRPRSMQNYLWFLRGHDELRDLFAWNSFAATVYVSQRPPWQTGNGAWKPRRLNDSDVVSATGWLEKFGLSPKTNETGQAVVTVSQGRAYNPIVDYLQRLKWDGCPRLSGGMWEGSKIESFPVSYLGSPDEAVYASMTKRFFVGAVARAVRPGCKHDSMIILEGAQGKKKSAVLNALATIDGVSYFTDSVADIEGKDAALQMQGVWIAEIAELNALNRKDANAIKAWLSRQVDRFRPPYGKNVQDFPRHTVLAGTVNPTGHGYLKDPTGWRRFWPVPISAIDLEAVVRDRDQLWAEAVVLYQRGEPHYMQEAEHVAAEEIASERFEDDPWAEIIDDYIRTLNQVSIREIIRAMGIPPERQNSLVHKRVAEHLKRRHWKRARKRIELHSTPQYVFVRTREEDAPFAVSED